MHGAPPVRCMGRLAAHKLEQFAVLAYICAHTYILPRASMLSCMPLPPSWLVCCRGERCENSEGVWPEVWLNVVSLRAYHGID